MDLFPDGKSRFARLTAFASLKASLESQNTLEQYGKFGKFEKFEKIVRSSEITTTSRLTP